MLSTAVVTCALLVACGDSDTTVLGAADSTASGGDGAITEEVDVSSPAYLLMHTVSDPPAPPNCVLRIKAGETEFDPTFFKVLDDVTRPSVAGSRFAYDAGNAMVWARDPGDFGDSDGYYAATRWTPFLVDPETWDAEQLVDPALVANGFPADTFFVDGAPHFTVTRTDGRPGGALVRFRDGALTEEVRYSDWLQAVARVR